MPRNRVRLSELPPELAARLGSGIKPKRAGRNQSASHTALVKQCVQLLTLWGRKCWKNPTSGIKRKKAGKEFWCKSGEKGHGDIVLIGDAGRHIEIECKTGTGKQTPHQVRRQAELESAGACYFVVRSVEDLMKLWDDHSL